MFGQSCNIAVAVQIMISYTCTKNNKANIINYMWCTATHAVIVGRMHGDEIGLECNINHVCISLN